MDINSKDRQRYLTNERVKAYKKRKRDLKPEKPPPKTNAERAKAYRDRKKQSNKSASQQPRTSGVQNLTLELKTYEEFNKCVTPDATVVVTKIYLDMVIVYFTRS